MINDPNNTKTLKKASYRLRWSEIYSVWCQQLTEVATV